MGSKPGNLPLPSQAPNAPRRSARKRVFDKTQHDSYDATFSTVRSPRRMQVQTAITSGDAPVIDLTGQANPPTAQASPRKRRKRADSPSVEKEERRRRVFRNRPPQSYLQKLDRARTQRLFVVDRKRDGTEDVPMEKVQIVGTTGNLYEVVIGLVPWCTCPDSQKGNQCKHIIYVLHNVLKVTGYLEYQLAFLSSELREIFANAPINTHDDATKENESGKRRPIQGDCPICFMEFEPETEEIVWCKAACGNNIHKACFGRWAATQQSNGVRCVICRSAWEVDAPMQQLLANGIVNDEGYVNVADQFGLSGERDYSTYHQPWSRGRYSRYYR
ncbi:RING finger domain-containing protein [Histoplasma ohiense]|nr:RING finger domain-containing protein [Histoplasma ohiense (nom. inval.)]